MGKKYSEQTPATPESAQRPRAPLVFLVSSDRVYAESMMAQCAEVPDDYTFCADIQQLADALAELDSVPLAFALIVEKTCQPVDPLLLRTCKLDHPEINYVFMLEECEQSSFLRFQTIGVQNVILPPFDEVNLNSEIDTALPNIPQFKRNSDLMKRGLVRLDFSIPSDLQYVLGVNYLVALLLKEFGFPTSDYRINIPLVCDEALTNAILHGNNGDPAKKVGIQIYVSASRFKIRVKDQGQGFDVGEVGDPREERNIMRSSGRGVYLMKAIMDSVEYKEEGRVVELEKINNSSEGSGSKS